METPYLDKNGLNVLIKEIRKSTAKTYKVKGSAIYADEAYLSASNPDKQPAIDSRGVWQYVDGAWTKVTLFEVGWVYNIKNRFKTDNDFVEGDTGTVQEAGTNIVVADLSDNVYKFDVLGNAIDLAEYQTKMLASPLTVFENGTPTVYATASALPVSEAKVSAKIEDQMIAIMSGEAEAGDVYRAFVSTDTDNATLNKIEWKKLGNQRTVLGSLELLANCTPNTPISEQEIIAMFNS